MPSAGSKHAASRERLCDGGRAAKAANEVPIMTGSHFHVEIRAAAIAN